MVKFADYYYEKPLTYASITRNGPYPAPVYVNEQWTYADVRGRSINRDKFEAWKTKYYELEGWDMKTGWPTRRTLESLGLGYVADELQSKEKLGASDRRTQCHNKFLKIRWTGKNLYSKHKN